MEVILFFVLVYAVKRGWEDAKSGAAKSRQAYMKRADAKHPDMPKSKRVAHTARHDFGHALSQVARGFPQARHGFGAGWHEGRQAHAQARAEHQRAKAEHLETRAGLIPDLTDYRRRQREALERIRSGQPEPGPLAYSVRREGDSHAWQTGDPEEAMAQARDRSQDGNRYEVSQGDGHGNARTMAAYIDGEADTSRRLDGEPAEMEADGRTYSYGSVRRPLAWPTDDLDVARRQAAAMSQDGTPQQVHEYHDGGPGELLDTYVNGEPVSPEEGRELDGQYAGERDAARREYAGQGWRGAAALLDPVPGEDDRNQSASPTEGNAMPASADTTYTQQLSELTAIRQDAEEEVNSVRRKRMLNRLDILTGLGLDSASLSEAAAIDDALQAQEKAAQQTLDAADVAVQGLTKRHGGIQEAVSSSPVDKPAAPEFYTD